MIFHEDEFIDANDSTCFDTRSEEIEKVSKDLSSKFHRYFQKS